MFDHGAQVTSWIPAGGSEVLWLSSLAAFASGTAIRGGVPICFPWFGGGPSGGMVPAHGFARIADWRFEGLEHDDQGVTAHYGLDDRRATSDQWPYRYEARYAVHLTDALSMTLEVRNLGDVPFVCEEALHAYVRVGDVREVRIEGLQGAAYADKASGERHVQSGPMRFAGQTDRVYASTGGLNLEDPVLGRTVQVTKAGSASTVVWNPGADLAASLSDVPDDDWPQFCCLETANALDQAVSLQPGQIHRMTCDLSLPGVVS